MTPLSKRDIFACLRRGARAVMERLAKPSAREGRVGSIPTPSAQPLGHVLTCDGVTPIYREPIEASNVLDEPSGYVAGDRVRVWGDDGPIGTVLTGSVVEAPSGSKVLNVRFDDDDLPGGRWPLLELVTAA